MRKKQLIQENYELKNKLQDNKNLYADLLQEFNHVVHYNTNTVSELNKLKDKYKLDLRIIDDLAAFRAKQTLELSNTIKKQKQRIQELERLIETTLANMIQTYDMNAVVLDNKPEQKEKLF